MSHTKKYSQKVKNNNIYNSYNTERLVWCGLLIIGSFLHLLSLTGLHFRPKLGFSPDTISENRMAIWLMLSITLISLSLFNYLWNKGKLYMFIQKNNLFQDNSVQKELVTRISDWQQKSMGWSKRLLCIAQVLISVVFAVAFFFREPNANMQGNMLYIKPSEAILITIFWYGMVLVVLAPSNAIEKVIANNLIKYKFKFTDKNCGLRPLISYLNSSLMFSINIYVFFILMTYSFLFDTDLVMDLWNYASIKTDSVPKLSIYIGAYASFIPMLMIINHIKIHSAKAYMRISHDLRNEKSKILAELERKDDLLSIVLYDKIKEKMIVTPINKVILPIKLLISPTFMAYCRNKVLSVQDIDGWIHFLFN